jgi:TetR/AcrR family transcriptional regulator, regulator of cefoperazone and chloramphenicol sensitivity
MVRRTTQPRQPKPPPRSDADQGTRSQLLEAAGQVFAEKGFDRATGKEICERAGTNTAAVNYYFGGMDGLYAAVVWEAHDRLVTVDAITSAIAGKADARAKLEAVIGLVVGAITGPASSSWMLRVLGREFVAPTSAVEPLREKEFLPKSRILKGIVGELMGLPPDHPAVARGCISIIAPCVLLLLFDRRTLKLAFPQFSLSSTDAPVIVRHMVQYALAGLAAIAAETRAQAQ